MGGQLFLASIPPHKHELNSTREYLERQLKKTKARIEIGKEATLELIEKQKPDAVIVATGILPLVPQIPGIDKPNVVSAEDILWGHKEAGNRAVVIGGEMVACETAEFLLDKGKKVTVVRRGPKMAVKVGPVQRGRLLTRLREKGVELIPGVQKYEAITEEGLELIDKDGKKQLIKADTVVYAVGVKANKTLGEQLKDKVPALYPVGDCVEPRDIYPAIDEGYRIGCKV